MRRTPAALADREFDVLIIGAGAFGAAAARDAALRGLKTALVDRGDFGAATSAECFKMVHGGIRYLQHADIPRLRASCRERSALLRIAPHLVHPLPIAIPTYGWGRRGRAFLGAGAYAYDLITRGRNDDIADPARQIRETRFLSRKELLQLFPHVDSPDLSGAVVFEDGQMHNPARLVLGFVQAAVAAGATACNYVEALHFLWDEERVTGVRVRDQESGDEFDIRARLTLNAAGPWADYLQSSSERFGAWRRLPFSRDAYIIVDRKPASPYGIAVQGLSRDKNALFGRSTRHLFAAPWRDKTLLGVWHKLFPANPDTAIVETREIDQWIEELNAVYPALNLCASEVTFANCGLVPFGETATRTELSFGKESRIVDHRATHGVAGLVSLVGIRYTTARADAARALDLLLEQGPAKPPPADTETVPLPGGDIADFVDFMAQAQRNRPPTISIQSLHGLLRNHGTQYRNVLEAGATVVPGTGTLRTEVGHAVEQEMALRLDDVVLRRTDLAAGSHPGRRALEATAAEMAHRLGWPSRRMSEEITATERTLARHLARPSLHPSETASDNGAMLATDATDKVKRWATRPSATQPRRA